MKGAGSFQVKLKGEPSYHFPCITPEGDRQLILIIIRLLGMYVWQFGVFFSFLPSWLGDSSSQCTELYG